MNKKDTEKPVSGRTEAGAPDSAEAPVTVKKSAAEDAETEPASDETTAEESGEDFAPEEGRVLVEAARDIQPSEESKAEETAPETLENRKTEIAEIQTDDVSATQDDDISKQESPIFKELAAPKLPELSRENRAQLHIQSPERIFFYWSIKHNPFATLQKALGNRARDYRLVAKLSNLKRGTEEVYPVEASGSSWLDVESGASYRAEVGFSAANRPFVRLIFSNTVETPRAAPSANLDLSPVFAVSANQFAEALDASGYRQDAFDVALAGDDTNSADEAANQAFGEIAGNIFDPESFDGGELRYVLFALATNVSLENLRGQMSPLLFDYLVNVLEEEPDALNAENVLPIWENNFGFNPLEETREQYPSATVFGASLINFPKITGRRRPRLSPVSSFR